MCCAVLCRAEEEKKAKRQFKLPKAFQRPGSRGSAADKATAAAAAAAAQAVPDADLPSPTSEAGSSHAAASGAAAAPAGGAGAGGQPVSASHQQDDFYGGGADGGEDPASPASPTAGTSPLRDAYHGARGGGGGGDLLSQADLVDYPYLIDGDPTPAAYLLLCCADYLRLYTTGRWAPGLQSGLLAALAVLVVDFTSLCAADLLLAALLATQQPQSSWRLPCALRLAGLNAFPLPFLRLFSFFLLQITFGWVTAPPSARLRLRLRSALQRPLCLCTAQGLPASMPATLCKCTVCLA
jgi:hypothetical protein